jgi:glutathione S-transferase
MRRIYHLVPRADWGRAPDAPYRPAPFAADGFIHCANADQVAWAANKFYADADDLLVLTIDAARLTSPLRDEDAGGGESFPHIYGPLNRDAVVAAVPLTRDHGGKWAFHL